MTLEEHPLSRTVHLHVGLAKSGTSYLQRMLRRNKDLLRESGVLYPGERWNSHFLAALDVRGVDLHGHTYPESPGAWRRLVDEVDEYPGQAVISHEMLARSSREVVRTAVSSFGTDDVRVVVTARDLGRQVPAVWQERLKHGNEQPYGEFLARIAERRASGNQNPAGFWGAQDPAGVAARWAEAVGPERTTVVTVPPTGADPTELWRRFAEALHLPDAEYAFDVGPANPSLGVVEAELLRRMNAHLTELPWPQYEKRVKTAFAEGRLAPAAGSARLTVPERYRPQVEAAAEQAMAAIADAGYRVVGDLRDLEPRWPEDSGPMPEESEEAAMLEIALRLLAGYASEPPRTVEVPVPRPSLWARLKGRLARG